MNLPFSNEDNSQPFTIDRNHFYFTSTTEEWSRTLDELAKMNEGIPPLPPEAFDCEWLYAEDEEVIEYMKNKKQP